jgi:hypothetical protein
MGRIAVALLAAVLASGCFAFEEIDSGQEIMDQHFSKGTRGKGAAGAPAAPEEKPEDAGILARVRGWWDAKQAQGGGKAGKPGNQPVADSGPPPHPDDVLVRCKVGSTTQFMRKFDCQLRGGRPVELESSASR